MKKYFSILAIFFSITLSFCQAKKRIYYNENLEEITKSNYYEQINHQKNLDLQFENDTQKTFFLITRKNYGQLNDNDFNNLKKSLSSDKELNNDLIVIVYYPGKDGCNGSKITSQWNIFHNDYLRKLNSISNNSHFWIYKDDENLKYYHPDQVKWEKDKNQLVENLFFTLHYPCFSGVVIDRSGKYISYFGEFGKNEIWELSKELKNNKVDTEK